MIPAPVSAMVRCICADDNAEKVERDKDRSEYLHRRFFPMEQMVHVLSTLIGVADKTGEMKGLMILQNFPPMDRHGRLKNYPVSAQRHYWLPDR